MKVKFDTPPVSATESEGLSVRYAKAKRNAPQWRWRLVMLALACIPLYFVARFLINHWWQEVPGQVIMQSSSVRAGVMGHVTYLAPEGSVLQRGDPLARVALAVPMAVAAPPVPEVATGALQPKVLTTDPREPALHEALGLANQQVTQLEQRAGQMRKLRAQEAATVQEVQSAELAALQARVQAARLRGELNELQEQRRRATRGMEGVPLAVAPASAASSAAFNPLQVAAREQVVYMPYTGTVAQHRAAEGEWIDNSTELVSIINTTRAVVHAYVNPRELTQAQPGTRATLIFQDGSHLPAEVIGPTSEAEQLPSESVSPLVPRNLSIVVRLKPLQPLPERYRVYRLPLEVRFEGPKSLSWFNKVVASLD